MMHDCKYNIVTLFSHDIDEFLANQTDKLIRFNQGAYSAMKEMWTQMNSKNIQYFYVV